MDRRARTRRCRHDEGAARELISWRRYASGKIHSPPREPMPAQPRPKSAAPASKPRVKAAKPVVDANPERAAAVRVLRQFRTLFNAVKTHFQQVEKSAGIGGAQLWALSIVKAQPGIGISALAQAMDIRQPTASIVVKALVVGGLVEARKAGADRRAVQLHLLKAGAAVLRRAPGPFAGVLPEALAELDEVTLKRLERDLAKLIAGMAADAKGARIPLADR